jgi:glycosyltransferase involved in cell wall biosynthesis
VPALTQALHQLATDGATRERMGREARHRAEKYFDWSVAAGRLESLYANSCNSPWREVAKRVGTRTPVAAP